MLCGINLPLFGKVVVRGYSNPGIEGRCLNTVVNWFDVGETGCASNRGEFRCPGRCSYGCVVELPDLAIVSFTVNSN